MKFEYYLDQCYFDMWTLRPIGNKNFNETLSFQSEQEILRTVAILEAWFNVEIELIRC